jgi:hypothetical protein
MRRCRSAVASALRLTHWLKGTQPILFLPLLGHYLRVHEEPDFHRRKALWTWTYNALMNVAILTKIFDCNFSHSDQITQWKRWDQDKQRAVLGHLRTGTFGPVIQAELGSWALTDLFDLT